MLSVTEGAVEAVVSTLEHNEVAEDRGLRLCRNDGGDLGLAVDEAHEGDQVVMQGERAVLFVERELATALDGATLDVVDEGSGARLTLLVPRE